MSVNGQLQFRRATAADWTSANPTLLDGELGLEKDTRRMKMGDGVTAWVSLTYIPTASALNIIAYDEGAQIVAAITSLNFAGQGVVATNSGSDVTVTIPTSLGGSMIIDRAMYGY